jgi:hypothetical protein
LPADPGGDGPAGGAYARVYYRQVDRAGWEVRGRAGQDQGRLWDVLGTDQVADVCYLRIGSDTPNDTFHDADIAVLQTEICH